MVPPQQEVLVATVLRAPQATTAYVATLHRLSSLAVRCWLAACLTTLAVAVAVSRGAAVRSALLSTHKLRLDLYHRFHSLQQRLRRRWHRLQPQGKRRKAHIRQRAKAVATRGALASYGRSGERRRELLKDKLGCVRSLPPAVVAGHQAPSSLSHRACTTQTGIEKPAGL